jgi:hypothetical protein
MLETDRSKKGLIEIGPDLTGISVIVKVLIVGFI